MNPRTAHWFADYAADHRHPTNRLTHKVAIPLIVFHIIAMLSWMPLGVVAGFPVTVAHIAWALAAIFWIAHLPKGGAVLTLATLPMLLWGGQVPAPVVIGIAVFGWTVQLAGHSIWEKNRPSFLKNALHALVGPLFFAAVLVGDWRVPVPAAD
jgi:uncharacterized membrane protein YGL010W